MDEERERKREEDNGESGRIQLGTQRKGKGTRLSGTGDGQGKEEQERNEVYLLKDRKDWKGICDRRENEKQSRCSQNKTFRRLQYGKAGACDTKN